MCCFVKLGMQSNCVGTFGSECLNYDACSVLADVPGIKTIGKSKENQLESSESTDVNNVCTSMKFQTAQGRLDCVNLCSTRSCCFTKGSGSCYRMVSAKNQRNSSIFLIVGTFPLTLYPFAWIFPQHFFH